MNSDRKVNETPLAQEETVLRKLKRTIDSETEDEGPTDWSKEQRTEQLLRRRRSSRSSNYS